MNPLERSPTGAAPACYRSGTAILTDNGERPVESLVAGDRVITASRRARRIRWIGRRGFSACFIAGDPAVLPIRVRAGALGLNSPSRDLYVSPRHALFIANVLVPAASLINGSSIVQVPVDKDLLYLHVELDSHDILLAEGAPAESYLDVGARGMFHDHNEITGAASGPSRTVARRVTAGPDLRAIQVLVSAFGRAGTMRREQW
jgi:hypothetical protein